MRIVIDIPEEIYKHIQEEQWLPNRLLIEKAIANGTPLPKGHGRLIDADDLNNHIIGYVDTRSCPTIIEADTESEGEE